MNIIGIVGDGDGDTFFFTLIIASASALCEVRDDLLLWLLEVK